MSQSKTKKPVGSTGTTTAAATSEQIRLAQILNGTQDNSSRELDAKIKQVVDITGRSNDDVLLVLHDYDYDVQKVIDYFLDDIGTQHQTEWKTVEPVVQKEKPVKQTKDHDVKQTQSKQKSSPKIESSKETQKQVPYEQHKVQENRSKSTQFRNGRGGGSGGSRGRGSRGRGTNKQLQNRGNRNAYNRRDNLHDIGTWSNPMDENGKNGDHTQEAEEDWQVDLSKTLEFTSSTAKIVSESEFKESEPGISTELMQDFPQIGHFNAEEATKHIKSAIGMSLEPPSIQKDIKTVDQLASKVKLMSVKPPPPSKKIPKSAVVMPDDLAENSSSQFDFQFGVVELDEKQVAQVVTQPEITSKQQETPKQQTLSQAHVKPQQQQKQVINNYYPDQTQQQPQKQDNTIQIASQIKESTPLQPSPPILMNRLPQHSQPLAQQQATTSLPSNPSLPINKSAAASINAAAAAVAAATPPTAPPPGVNPFNNPILMSMPFYCSYDQNYPYFDHTQLDGGASIMQMYQLTQQMAQVPMSGVPTPTVVPTTSVAQSNVNYSLSDNAKYSRDPSSLNQVSVANGQQQQQPNQTMAHNYSTYPWIFPSPMYPIMTMPNGTQAPTPQGQYSSQQSTGQNKPSYSQSASSVSGTSNYRAGLDQNIKSDLKSLNDKAAGYHTPPPPPGTNQQASLAAQYQAQLQQQYAYMIQQQQQVQQRDQNSLKQQQLSKGTYSNWS